MNRIAIVVLALLCAGLTGLSKAADAAKAEDLFPESTFAAVIVPDLGGLRAAANKTEAVKMYGAPEMQEFLRPALDQLKKSYAEVRAGNPLLPSVEDLDAALFSGEAALGVFARPHDMRIPVGFAVTLMPKDAGAFLRLLPPAVRETIRDGEPIPMGVGAIAPRPTDPGVAIVGGRVLFCFPGADLPNFLARAKDPAARVKTLGSSALFAGVRAKMPASSALFFAAPSRFSSFLFNEISAAHNLRMKEAAALFKVFGFDNINAIGIGVGFTATDPVVETVVSQEKPGQPGQEGLLDLLAGTDKPIDPRALAIAAPDAPFVAGGSLNFAGLLPLFKRAAASFGVEGVEVWSHLDEAMATALHFDLQKDLLENLGTEVVMAQTVFDTGAPLTFGPGLAYSIAVKDAAKVEACFKKMSQAEQKAVGIEALGGVKLRVLQHRGKTIYYLAGVVMAGSGAFCVHGDRLIAGTSVNAVRRTIEQLEKKENILGNKKFQEALARVGGRPFDPQALPAGFAYSIDQGSGSGALLLTGMGLLGATGLVAGAAEIPSPAGRDVQVGGRAIEMNEKAAIAATMVYAESQEIYRRTDYDQDGVLEYATSFKGKHSLFEINAGAGDLQFIDKAMAEAEGQPDGKASKAGYRFKILKGQDEFGDQPKRSYIDPKENMTLGYALIAYPVQYGATGKHSFQINNNGTVYAKDLGPETADLVSKQTNFKIDLSWTPREVDFGQPNPGFAGLAEVERFLKRPSGKAVLDIAQTVDLNLWPDEGFFARYRRPTAAVSLREGNWLYSRSELPAPGPVSNSSINALVVVAAVAIVAGIAIPSLMRSRLATNQTAAAAACKAFAEAQEIYRRTDWDADGILEYAQSIKGDNSLLERKAGAGDIAMVDRSFGAAEGKPNEAVPKAGYLFKVLKAQGPDAAGGKRSYVVNGNMVLGYAVIAYPAAYDGTGRDCFIINNSGVIYQTDFGPETHAEVEKMTEFNPTPGIWVPTE